MIETRIKCAAEGAKFNVPLNWSEPFLDFIIDQKEHVSSVYGSVVGNPGGRPIPHSHTLRSDERPDLARLERFTSKLRDAGIDFNHAMNASCYGARLLEDEGKAWIRDQLGLLRRLGIEHITVTSFSLARQISAIAPEMKLILSVMHNIVDIDAVIYASRQDFNLAGIVVGKGVTRQISRLKRILALLRQLGLRAIVMANDFCPVPNCPERMSDHNNACAHYNENPVHYVSPSINCRSLAMADPSHFLRAPVINPFDIPYYQNLGIKEFKLTDRVMPDPTLVAVCRAYFDCAYDGNIFDLFTYTSYLGGALREPRRLTTAELREIFHGGYPAFKAARNHFVCQPYASARDLAGPHGFFDFFTRDGCSMQCGSAVAGIAGCTYCEDMSRKFLTYDQESWLAVRDNISRYISISRERRSSIAPEQFEPAPDAEGGSDRTLQPAQECRS